MRRSACSMLTLRCGDGGDDEGDRVAIIATTTVAVAVVEMQAPVAKRGLHGRVVDGTPGEISEPLTRCDSDMHRSTDEPLYVAASAHGAHLAACAYLCVKCSTCTCLLNLPINVSSSSSSSPSPAVARSQGLSVVGRVVVEVELPVFRAPAQRGVVAGGDVWVVEFALAQH